MWLGSWQTTTWPIGLVSLVIRSQWEQSICYCQYSEGETSKMMSAGRKRDERLMIGGISLHSHTSSAVHFIETSIAHTHTHTPLSPLTLYTLTFSSIHTHLSWVGVWTATSLFIVKPWKPADSTALHLSFQQLFISRIHLLMLSRSGGRLLRDYHIRISHFLSNDCQDGLGYRVQISR